MNRRRNHQQGTPLTDEGKRKINKLFAAMRKNNIIARQNFTCCGNCGVSEMDDALKQDALECAAEGWERKIGFAFYHKQDGARLEEEAGTYITYGDPKGDDGRTVVIGELIVGLAKDHGLFTKWSGKAADRIYVSEVPA